MKKKLNKGFTLMEMMLTVAVMGVVMLLLAQGFNKLQQRNIEKQMIAEWADEMTQLDNALEQIIGRYFDDYALDTTVYVSLIQVQGLGYIPLGFGDRFESTNNSPLGMKYRIALRKYMYDLDHDTNTPDVEIMSGVILNTPQNTDTVFRRAPLKKLGLYEDANNKIYISKDLSTKVLVEATKLDRNIKGGLLDNLTTNVNGVSSSFTKNISDYIPTDMATRNNYTPPVLLWGFPDVNGCAGGVNCGGDGGPITEPPVDTSTCRFSKTPTYYKDVVSGVLRERLQACQSGGNIRGNPIYSSGHSTFTSPIFEHVDGYGNIGYMHTREIAGKLGNYQVPAARCLFYKNINEAASNQPQDVAYNQCINTPVYTHYEALSVSGAIAYSEPFLTYGSYDFQYCGPGCGTNDQVVTYEVDYDHVNISICCGNDLSPLN
jgi:prepilin-type N-terminal cleavage/methylation domain-containing protein